MAEEPVPTTSTPHVKTNRSDSTESLTMSDLPMSILRTDLESKSVGLLYKFKPLPLEFGSLTFDVTSDLASSNQLVLYDPDASNKEFQDDWSEHDPQVEHEDGSGSLLANYDDVAGPLRLRSHRSWLKSSLSSDPKPHEMIELNNTALRDVIEIIQAHRYVGMMLSRFQDDLEACFLSLLKHNASHAQRLGQFHMRSRAFKVIPIFALQTVGTLSDEIPAWWILEQNIDVHSREACVCKNNFDVKPPGWNPWKELVDAFIHNTYHLSQASTLIIQMYIDHRAKLSNIVCVRKQSPQYKGASMMGDEAMKMAFWHFQSQHKCNFLCQNLNLPAFENNF